MGLIVLDAGVVIALLERRDVHHKASRSAVMAARVRGDHFVLPASTYSEIMVGPSRQGPSAVAEVDGIVDALPSAVVSIDRAIALSAARLRALHGRALRLPDALVLATAEVLEAERVMTTDSDLVGRGVGVELIGAA
jgi:predicted nucleic acid-binding protein